MTDVTLGFMTPEQDAAARQVMEEAAHEQHMASEYEREITLGLRPEELADLHLRSADAARRIQKEAP